MPCATKANIYHLKRKLTAFKTTFTDMKQKSGKDIDMLQNQLYQEVWRKKRVLCDSFHDIVRNCWQNRMQFNALFNLINSPIHFLVVQQ